MKLLETIKMQVHNKHLHSLIGNGLAALLGMLVSMVLYRSLSLADMGVWIVFFSTILLFDTIRSGIINMAFVKFYAGSTPERANIVIGSTWYLALILTTMLLLFNVPLFFVADMVPNRGISLFLKWFGISYLASLPFFVASCVLQAEQRFDRLLVLRLINQGIFVLSLVCLWFLERMTVYMVIAAYLGANTISSLFALFAGWSQIGKLRNCSVKVMYEVLNFGKYSLGTNLSATLLGSVDTYIIHFMLGAPALAVFNTGMRLLQVVEIPLQSFASNAMPVLSGLYNKGDKESLLVHTKRYMAALSLIFIGLAILICIFADLAVWMLAGEKYVHTEAPQVLRFYMLIALCYPMDRFLALLLDVIHKPQVNLWKVLLMLLVNVTVSMIYLYFFHSIFGVAVGALAAMIVSIIVSSRVLNKCYATVNWFKIYTHLSFSDLRFFMSNQGK